MDIMLFFKLYGLAFVSLIGIDAIWLAKIAPNLYKSNIGHLMAEKPNLIAAGFFYLIYIVGLVVFVIQPAYEKGSVSHAAIYGALFGLVAYATFDLTSQAVFKDWPTKITIIDLIWGTILTAGVCSLATYLALQFVK